MGCKHIWNRAFIDSFCTKQFRNMDLKQHREMILFDRERARMPETQPLVEREMKLRKLRHIATLQRNHLITLLRAHFYGHAETIHPEIQRLQNDMEHTHRELELVRDGGVPLSMRFVRKCPLEMCKGFLNNEWFCGLCEAYYCKACNERHTDDHVCNPETVQTMALLGKDTKPCPKCGTMIHKIDGCSQMWCTECHTAFNWTTGIIETGRIHNPHFIQFKRTQRVINSREHGDIPCGGLPSMGELIEERASGTILRFALAIHTIERDNALNDPGHADNTDIRILYMLNDMNEDMFKKNLQRREKMRDRSRDMTDIYELIIHAGGDLLRQYMLELDRHDEIVGMLTHLMTYANDIFRGIRERYTTVIPPPLIY